MFDEKLENETGNEFIASLLDGRTFGLVEGEFQINEPTAEALRRCVPGDHTECDIEDVESAAAALMKFVALELPHSTKNDLPDYQFAIVCDAVRAMVAHDVRYAKREGTL